MFRNQNFSKEACEDGNFAENLSSINISDLDIIPNKDTAIANAYKAIQPSDLGRPFVDIM